MEVKGEYMAASSTVGGGRYARPPPLALCQFPLLRPDMVASEVAQCERGLSCQVAVFRNGCGLTPALTRVVGLLWR
jgi:hypothetical protein